MNGNHLSPRLAAVADQVPDNSRLADIGSDHAYVPIYLAQRHIISFGVVGEVAAGPLSNAQRDIQTTHLNHMLMPRLADGLSAIRQDDAIDTITIAGMGGRLIISILNNGTTQLVHHPRLILQPNTDVNEVREWLMNHQYRLINEKIVKEDRHIYEVLVAEWQDRLVHYSEIELMFGPFLMTQRSPVFVLKWQNRARRYRNALSQMSRAKNVPSDKIKMTKHELEMIDEVLNHERN